MHITLNEIIYFRGRINKKKKKNRNDVILYWKHNK